MPHHPASAPLLLLPGFMLDGSLWDDLIDRLQYDAPIYRPALAPGTTIDEIASGIANAAPGRFILIGFSLGGYVARKVAELFPRRVIALILIATSLKADTRERVNSRRGIIDSMNSENFRGLSSISIANALHPDRRDEKELIARIQRMGTRLGYDALVIQSHLQRHSIAAASLTCPTLVIAAAEDPLRTAEETRELADTIPNATLRIIRKSGHMIPLEQPEALADAITLWLKSLAPS